MSVIHGQNINERGAERKSRSVEKATALSEQFEKKSPKTEEQHQLEAPVETGIAPVATTPAAATPAKTTRVDAEPQHSVAATRSPSGNLIADRQRDAAASIVAGLGIDSLSVQPHPGTDLGPGVQSDVVVNQQHGWYMPQQGQQQLHNIGLESTGYEQRNQQQEQETIETGRQQQEAETDITAEHKKAAEIRREDRYAYRDAKGRADTMEFGHMEKPAPVNTNSKSNKRFRRSFENYRDKIKQVIQRKSYRGSSFYNTISTDSNLLPHEVAIGTEDIREALREPNCQFLDLVNQKLAERYGEDFPELEREAVLADMTILINLINGVSDSNGGWVVPPIDIEVTLDKTPVNWGPSVQVRTLRVRSGDGIYLHPTQVKGFNADFDGDPGSLNLDQTITGRHSRAMSYLLDTEGRPMIDTKFFPIDQAPAGGRYEEQMVQCMIERDFAWLPITEPSVMKHIRQVARAYINLCNGSESVSTDQLWKNLLQELDDMATLLDEMQSGVEFALDEDGVLTARSYNSYTDNQMSKIRKQHNDNVSRLFGSLYDFGVTRRRLSLQTQYKYLMPGSNEEQQARPPRETVDPAVWHLVAFHDDIAQGRRAPNFQAFAKFFHKTYGEGESDTNIPFRLVADFAKAINRSDAIRIGDDIFGIYSFTDESGETREYVTMEELWRFTCSCAVSAAMSNELHAGSRDVAISTAMRGMVVSEMGPIPDWSEMGSGAEAAFGQWISKFIEVYNKHRRMLNVSQVAWRYGMTPTIDGATAFDGISDSAEDHLKQLADALVKIYGDMTVGTFMPIPIQDYRISEKQDTFKDITDSTGAIHRKYADMSLSEFVYRNRIIWGNGNSGYMSLLKRSQDKNDALTHEDAMEEVLRRSKNGELSSWDVMYILAEKGKAQTKNYNREWMAATEAHFNRINLESIREKARNGQIDEVMADIMECIHLLGPDMFDFYGMSSPESFLNSEYGRRFFESRTLDEFRSNLISMQTEYRLARGAQILDEIDSKYEREAIQFTEGASAKPSAMAERLDSLETQFAYEIDSLGSSSMVWDSIIREMYGMNAWHDGSYPGYFKYLCEHPGESTVPSISDTESSRRVFEQAENGTLNGCSTLVEYLKSDAPVNDKILVLLDITRLTQGYSWILKEEILGQLAHHPDRLHAGNRFDMDKGLKDDIDAIKESTRKSSIFMKGRKQVKQESAKIIEEAKRDKHAFEKHLEALASDPGYHVYVDPILACDALASIYDPTYSDSEKIRQQGAVNGYFECISYQRSGGFYTHLHQTDNAVVNFVSGERMTVSDIIRVLADPTLSITVYDEFGCSTRQPVSRSTLCGSDRIEDVIAFLEANPKIALATRRLECGITTTGKDRTTGIARLNVLGDQELGMSDYHQVFSLLADRPRFLAIANLITPADADVSRNMSERLNGSLEYLCFIVSKMAKENKPLTEQTINEVMSSIGLTYDKIASIRVGEFEYYLDDAGIIPQEEFDELAQKLINSVVGELLDCITLVRSAGIQLNPYGSMREIDIDESSIRAYYAAKQQLSGARTAKMIGIEGGETKRNLVLKEYLRNLQPTWAQTERGPMRVDTVSEHVTMTDDGAYVWADTGEIIQDLTMETDPRKQVNPIAKFLEIKREKGAENFNAKSKKYGDDGTNSIIKFIRMAPRSVLKRYGKHSDRSRKNGTWSLEDGAELAAAVKAIGDATDNPTPENIRERKDAAVELLAAALIDADKRLGYIDVDDSGTEIDEYFVKSDYYNRAELMIAYNSDGSVAIRTLEQLSLACNTRLSDDAIMSEDEKTILAEIQQIIDVVGTDMDPMLVGRSDNGIAIDCMNGVRVYNGSGIRHQAARAIRERSFSEKESYDLMKRYRRRFEDDYRKHRKERAPQQKSRAELAELGELVRSRLAAQIPSDFMVEIKKITDQDANHSYDLVGASSKMKPDDINPGPLSLVVFDEPNWQTGDNAGVHRQKLTWCKNYGMTAAFFSLEDIPDEYIKDAIRISEHVWIVPFFDMMMNGSASSTAGPAPGEYICNPANFTVCYEDTTSDMAPGDSTFHMTKELFDRVRVFRSHVQTFDWNMLFPNVVASYPRSILRMDYCSLDEIEDIVLDGHFDPETGMITGGVMPATIDLGVDMARDTDAYKREAERFAIRLEEYKKRREDIGRDSIVAGECRPDSIVGFVKIIINESSVALAPIMSFPLEKSGKVPQRYEIDRFELDPDTNSFTMSCHYSGGLKGHLIKFFEGIGASNKMIANDQLMRSRELQNGMAIDGAYSTGTVSSRLFSSNKRAHTMISMLMITRMDAKYAYNLADDGDSFPGNPTVQVKDPATGDVEDILVKDALADCRMTNEMWRQATGWTPDSGCTPGFFHRDPEIDALCRYWVDACMEFGTVNPTTLLATKSRTGMLVPRYTEFEAFLDSGFNFQNAFMKFMHRMTVDQTGAAICPPSIEDDASKHLFKPVSSATMVSDTARIYPRYKAEDYGVLQMLVPHFDPDTDEMYYVPENVFISNGFFGDEFTGFKKKNFNAYNESTDNLNVAHGNIGGFSLSQLMSFARASMGDGVQTMGAFEIVPDEAKDGYGSWYVND